MCDSWMQRLLRRCDCDKKAAAEAEAETASEEARKTIEAQVHLGKRLRRLREEFKRLNGKVMHRHG